MDAVKLGGRRDARSERISALGERLTRYGLVLVIVWFGLMKFTRYEADGILPLVANSPLLGWMYRYLGVRGLSDALGVVELLAATLLALRPLSSRAAVVGGGMAVVMFLITLSFLATTPNAWEPSLGGFPVPGPTAGFLLKDVVLLAASVWLVGEALRTDRPAS
ncbi:MAG TPA: DUF417 family protein [Candidatus Methylomirabilis sp.]|nr:DUF417 family protein [Candidatus Methylomirabilis sp.]